MNTNIQESMRIRMYSKLYKTKSSRLKEDLSFYFFCNFPVQDAYSNFEAYWKLRKKWLRGKKIYASLTDDEKMHLERYLPK